MSGSTKKFTILKAIHMSADMARAVEDFRWDNRIGSEAEALRRIVTAGLLSLGAKAAEVATEEQGRSEAEHAPKFLSPT